MNKKNIYEKRYELRHYHYDKFSYMVLINTIDLEYIWEYIKENNLHESQYEIVRIATQIEFLSKAKL